MSEIPVQNSTRAKPVVPPVRRPSPQSLKGVSIRPVACTSPRQCQTQKANSSKNTEANQLTRVGYMDKGSVPTRWTSRMASSFCGTMDSLCLIAAVTYIKKDTKGASQYKRLRGPYLTEMSSKHSRDSPRTFLVVRLTSYPLRLRITLVLRALGTTEMDWSGINSLTWVAPW